jgi:hypothetical protein
MGAATSVMFYGAYKPLLKDIVVSLILDSPFTSFYGLADDYVKTKMQLPSIFLSPALHYLKRSVETKYNFNLLQMSPYSAANEVNILSIVLSGKDDKIVSPHISHELYSQLGGPKLRIYFDGGHNSHRPPEIFEAIQEIIRGSQAKETYSELLNYLANMLQHQDIPINTFPTIQANDDNVLKVNVHDIDNNASENNNLMSPVSFSPIGNVSNRNNTGESDVKAENAEKIAEETQQAIAALLKTKSLRQITNQDVHFAISQSSVI